MTMSSAAIREKSWTRRITVWTLLDLYWTVKDDNEDKQELIYLISFLPLRRYPDSKDKVKALYIRIVSPFPEMERFLQDTIKR